MMGAQRADATAPSYDPQADSDESPAHEVTLSAFFLGKHELTRGQWVRIAGSKDLSFWREETSGGRVMKAAYAMHPVETVSWLDGMRELELAGLALPTEAQWEYGCRAGTATPFFFGKTSEGFERYANLADEECARAFNSPVAHERGVNDGHAVTAPVGSFLANGFGLHDVHGNVWEWCADEFGPYGRPHATGDGRLPESGSGTRVARGGSYDTTAAFARSALRYGSAPANADVNLGLRVSRGITP